MTTKKSTAQLIIEHLRKDGLGATVALAGIAVETLKTFRAKELSAYDDEFLKVEREGLEELHHRDGGTVTFFHPDVDVLQTIGPEWSMVVFEDTRPDDGTEFGDDHCANLLTGLKLPPRAVVYSTVGYYESEDEE